MLLYLKIKPNQRYNRLEEVNGSLQARIKEPAIDGKANDGLIGFLSEILDLPKSKIRLIKGQTSKLKCLEIDAGQEWVEMRLNKALQDFHNKM